MKNLLFSLTVIASLFIMKPELALAQRGGGHTTPPPDPNNVHLFNRTLNTSGYGGTPVGEMHLFETQGPGVGSPFISFAIFHNEISFNNLYDFGQPAPGFGGPYNDRAASVAFTGNCVGTYTFYDSQDGYVSDDYTEVYVKVALPTGKSYYVWEFEQNYEDDYVKVTYHHVNGLVSGKLSGIQVHKSQSL